MNGEECVSGSAWEGSVTKRSSRKWSLMHSLHGEECVKDRNCMDGKKKASEEGRDKKTRKLDQAKCKGVIINY